MPSRAEGCASNIPLTAPKQGATEVMKYMDYKHARHNTMPVLTEQKHSSRGRTKITPQKRGRNSPPAGRRRAPGWQGQGTEADGTARHKRGRESLRHAVLPRRTGPLWPKGVGEAKAGPFKSPYRPWVDSPRADGRTAWASVGEAAARRPRANNGGQVPAIS